MQLAFGIIYLYCLIASPALYVQALNTKYRQTNMHVAGWLGAGGMFAL